MKQKAFRIALRQLGMEKEWAAATRTQRRRIRDIVESSLNYQNALSSLILGKLFEVIFESFRRGIRQMIHHFTRSYQKNCPDCGCWMAKLDDGNFICWPCIAAARRKEKHSV